MSSLGGKGGKKWVHLTAPTPEIFSYLTKSRNETEKVYLIAKDTLVDVDTTDPSTNFLFPNAKTRGAVWKWSITALATIVIITCTILGIYCAVNVVKLGENEDTEEVLTTEGPQCKTSTCHEVADELKSFMDTRFDPCQDFYMYSCGQWMELKKPIEIESSTDALGEITKEDAKTIRDILENLEDSDSAARKAQKFYMSCLDKKEPATTTTTVAPTFNWMDWDSPSLTDYYDDVDDDDDPQDYNDDWKLDYQTTTKATPKSDYDDDYDWFDGLSPKIRKSLQPFLEIEDKKESLSLTCTTLTQQLFPDVTARLFVTAKFPPAKSTKIRSMLREISEIFQERISRITWMDYETKFRIADKISQTGYMLGYPDSVLDVEKQIWKYADVDVSSDGSAYYYNVAALQPIADDSFSFYDQTPYVSVGNAFYVPTRDYIFIPAGLAQKPFFDFAYPDIINYAKFVSVLGHEYSHAFEEYISKEEDSLRWDWDTPSNDFQENFDERKKCVQDQYENFKLRNSTVSLDKISTWNENVADVLGLQLAFSVFIENYMGNFLPLPGLQSFTPEKLFFIAMAQTSCRAFTDDETRERMLLEQIEWDEHSPNSIRVLGEMVNNEEFSKAFNCPVGSKYNPPFEKKCRFFD